MKLNFGPVQVLGLGGCLLGLGFQLSGSEARDDESRDDVDVGVKKWMVAGMGKGDDGAVAKSRKRREKTNPLSPPCVPPTSGLRGLPAKSKFLAAYRLYYELSMYRDPSHTSGTNIFYANCFVTASGRIRRMDIYKQKDFVPKAIRRTKGSRMNR